YRTEQALHGKGDVEFLKRSFTKLTLNFSWWVNRKDRFGKNLFEGGFLGLDAHDSFFEDMAMKFADHFLWIARAMNQTGPEGMWDDEDGFYYDVLRIPDGSARRLKVRSM